MEDNNSYYFECQLNNSLIIGNKNNSESYGAIEIFNADNSTGEFRSYNNIFFSNECPIDINIYCSEGGTPIGTSICNNLFESFNKLQGVSSFIGQLFIENTNGDSTDLYGNLSLDPLFVDKPYKDYALNENSPCINAGKADTSGLNLPEKDLAGNSRIKSNIIDIGPYEYQPESDNDLNIIQWLFPSDSCSFSNSQNIAIKIYNRGALSQAAFNISYSSDNGQTYITENVTKTINSGDTLIYTFTQTADFSFVQNYNCIAVVSLTGDENRDNDTLRKTISHYELSTSLQADFAICKGNDSTILAESGFNSYLWSDGSTESSLTISSADTFVVTVSDAVGCTATDSVIVSIIELPDKPEASSVSNCYGETIDPLTAIGSAIKWYSDGELTNLVYEGSTYNHGQTDAGSYTYYATQTTNGCEGNANTVTVTINDFPDNPGTITGKQIVCSGEPFVHYDVPEIAFAEIYTWNLPDGASVSEGENTNSISVDYSSDAQSGDITVISSNGCGSSAASAPLSITVNVTPAAPTSTNLSACSNSTIPQLGAEGTDITWYSDAELANEVFSGNTFTTGKTLAGSYVYYVTETIKNCESEAARDTLTIHPIPQIDSIITTAVSDCASENGSITFYVKGNGLEYSVDNGENFFATNGFTNLSIGSYYPIVRNNNECEINPEDIIITNPDAPLAPVVSPDTSYCFGEAISDIEASTTEDGTLTWYADFNHSSIIGNNNLLSPENTVGIKNYYVTESIDGCEGPHAKIEIVIITVPSAPMIDEISVCFGDSIPDFIATGINVKWFEDAERTSQVDTGNTFSHGISDAGAYTWYVSQEVNNCQSLNTEAELTIHTLPEINFSKNEEICFGDSVQIGSKNSTGNSYSWKNNEGETIQTVSDPYVKPLSDNKYFLEQTIDSSGCKAYDSVSVIVRPIPTTHITESNNPIFIGEQSTLVASGAVNYQWSPVYRLNEVYNDTVISSALISTKYFVEGTNNFGCSVSDSIYLQVLCTPCSGGEIIYEKSGSINHGCTENNYSDNLSCNWLLTPAGAQKIYFEIVSDSFDIIPGDQLIVYDGQDASSSLIGIYDNENIPKAVIASTSNKLYIEFISNGTDNGNGFQANFWSDNSNTLTGSTIENHKVNISPNPASELFYIEGITLSSDPLKVSIFTITGELVSEHKILPSAGRYQTKIHVAGLMKGTYIVRLESAEYDQNEILILK
ncbi:MAG: hypothetical protein JXB49_15380 [Bacteroidales bacterium]|nr:hypothetical protein [Bacteroidales bacterium]MBN2817959.1 hypothetical protein [Bacteroidales bacterium]